MVSSHSSFHLEAGSLVIFDSRKIWPLGSPLAPFFATWLRHAVAPSLRGDRWAMTLWLH